MDFIRWLLGRIILFFDRLTQPKRPAHSPEKQAQLDAQTSNMTIYQYAACPFCVKTRRAIRRLGLNIELRDAKNDSRHRQELEQQGGKQQVPCLRIEAKDGSVTWLYESSEIIAYLQKRFA
ncbi:glutaredoxin family protein [Thiolapillus sp.]